jgi:branched-chain amino acid transport system ATP-binding protein
MATVLKIEGLTHYFGGLAAVNNFDLIMESGDLVGLIGPNGAGKTTIFNLITGVYRPTHGTIFFNDVSLVGQKSHQITAKGISRTFQTIRLYGDLPVWQNVAMGSQFRVKYGLAAAVLRLPVYYQEEKAIYKKVVDLLELFGLADRINELAKNLPYGEQRRLEICRALAADPQLLLLDEPAAGMNPNEVEELLGLIRWVHREFKLTTLLIEHQMKLVMNICPHIVVIDFGQIIARGNPEEIQSNESVIEAYLGRVEEEN